VKEIKAYVHSNRIADVIATVESSGLMARGEAAGIRNINVTMVRSLLKPLDGAEQRYSVALGEAVIDELRLELVCEDHQVADLVAMIERSARTGQKVAGWIVVTDVVELVPIKGSHA
jgi:nitrogen regulatory protein P-II 1